MVEEYVKRKFEAMRKDLQLLHGRILDVGCSCGFSPIFLIDVDYLGIDINNKAIQGEGTNVPFIVASATHLPFIDVLFDAVLFLDVIEHIAPPLDSESLQEVVRVLAKHGKIVISTPNMDTLFNKEAFAKGDHVNCMTPYILKEKLSDVGLHIEKRISGDIFIIPPNNLVSRLPFKVRRIIAKLFSRLDKYYIIVCTKK